MLKPLWVIATIVLSSCGHRAPASPPEPEEPGHEEATEIAGGPECAPRLGSVANPDSASETLQVWAEELVGQVAQALERRLCVVALEDVRTGDRRLSGSLTILDRESADVHTIPIATGQSPSQTRPAWRPRGLPGQVAARVAVRTVHEWLAQHSELVGASRREINQGLHFLRLQQTDRTNLCLQWRHQRGSGKTWCWTERRSIDRVVDSEFEYTDGDLEEEFAGFLAFDNGDGSVGSLAVRFPAAERAPAPGLGLPAERERLPPWFPNSASQPYRRVPSSGWAAFNAVESEHLGPLSFLRVTPLGEGILGLESDQEHRICARFDVWVCSAAVSRRQDARHATWTDGLKIDGDRIGAMVATLPDNPYLPEAQPGGELRLVLFSRRENTLDTLGSLITRSVSWTSNPPGPSRIEVARSFHRVQSEAGCLRFEPVTTDAGQVDRQFRSLSGRRTQPTLTSAGEEVSYGAASEVQDLGGLWELEAEGMRKTLRCESSLGEFTDCPGRLPSVPEGLPEAAKECLAQAIEAARSVPESLALTGEPCGAVERHRGRDVARYVYQYAEGRRVRQEYENLSHLRAGSRTIDVTTFSYRGEALLRETTVSTQYDGDEPDCVNEFDVAYTLNPRGHPRMARHTVSTCEGVDAGSWRVPIRFSSEIGYDRVQVPERGTGGVDQVRYEVPSIGTPQASVSCRHEACTCSVELRSCEGHPIARVSHGREPSVLTYLHDCE